MKLVKDKCSAEQALREAEEVARDDGSTAADLAFMKVREMVVFVFLFLLQVVVLLKLQMSVLYLLFVVYFAVL